MNLTLPSFYIGQTANPPSKRFEQHKRGYKANKYVKLFGMRLCPEISDRFNPIETREKAEQLEKSLGKKMRNQGYGVWWN